MHKTDEAARKPQTHFEQVPLEVVKKIAKEDVSEDKKAGTGTRPVKPAARDEG